MIREQKYQAIAGLPMLLLFLVAAAFEVAGFFNGVADGSPALAVGSALALLLTLFLAAGLFVVNPNEGRVLQLFGDYKGTVRIPRSRPSSCGRWSTLPRPCSRSTTTTTT